MGSEESTKSNRYRALIWANVALAALLALFVLLAVAFLYKPGDTASYETADRYLQEMKKLSSQGLFAVTEEVDHMYHYLTNTNDDDGHVIMDTSSVSKADAHAALAGEEPVPENHPMAAKSRIEQGGTTAMDLEELPEEEDSDGRSADREEEERVAEQRLAEENPQEQETEGHDAEIEEEEEEVTEDQRKELQRLEEHDKKLERVAALDKETMALMEMGAHDLIVPMARVLEKEAVEDEAAGDKGGGKDAKFIELQMVKRKASHKSHPVCGDMPSSFGPKFSQQREPPQGKTKFYPSKDGFVMPMNLQMKQIKVPTEHGKRGSRKATNKRSLKKGEQALVDCLNHLGKCNSQSMRAALNLRGMKEALAGSRKLLSKKYDNCAVVGNSGGMMHHQYGKYIDVHDYVMRINALPMDGPNGRRDHLGSKVDGRVLSYKISKDVCCIKKDYRADNKALEYFIWFPAAQKQVAMRMKKTLKANPVRMMQKPFVKSAVLVFKAFRGELLRLGYGPFEDWEYMTSGMHAVLGMVRSCENLDVYGFTTDLNNKGPYWFTGRTAPPRSGQTQHAWDHERMVLRLLHAAGAVNLCTS